MHLSLWQAALHRRLSPAALLAALLLPGCSESPTFLKPGPHFATAQEVPSNQGQVYFYWPAEEQSRWSELMVGICEETAAWVQPGGYTRVLVSPGRQCFQAEGTWEMTSSTSASLALDRLDLDVAAGQTLFVRVENGDGLAFSGTALRSVEPAKAEPEIQRCGEMIPLSEEEMRQAWRAREPG